MVKGLGLGPIAGHRNHEATHMTISLTSWAGKNLGVWFEPTQDAYVKGHQRGQELTWRITWSDNRRRPEVGVPASACS